MMDGYGRKWRRRFDDRFWWISCLSLSIQRPDNEIQRKRGREEEDLGKIGKGLRSQNCWNKKAKNRHSKKRTLPVLLAEREVKKVRMQDKKI